LLDAFDHSYAEGRDVTSGHVFVIYSAVVVSFLFQTVVGAGAGCCCGRVIDIF
jgi:hypothetical protein